MKAISLRNLRHPVFTRGIEIEGSVNRHISLGITPDQVWVIMSNNNPPLIHKNVLKAASINKTNLGTKTKHILVRENKSAEDYGDVILKWKLLLPYQGSFGVENGAELIINSKKYREGDNLFVDLLLTMKNHDYISLIRKYNRKIHGDKSNSTVELSYHDGVLSHGYEDEFTTYPVFNTTTTTAPNNASTTVVHEALSASSEPTIDVRVEVVENEEKEISHVQ